MISEIGTSICCYASTFVLCHVLRLIARRALPGNAYAIAVEFIDTFHMVCCLYENGMVLKIGLMPFAMILFTLVILYAFLFEGYVNPAVVFDRVLRGKLSVSSGWLRVALELLGAVAAYRYTSFMWMTVAPSPKHYQAAAVDMIAENCRTGLNVSAPVGFAVEMLSVAFLTVVSVHFHGGRRFWRVINAVISVFVVIFGLNYTGALMNPVLGLAVGWGCQDHWMPSQALVYWLGPLAGITLGDLIVAAFMNVEDTAKSTGQADKNGSVMEQNGNHEKIH